MLEEIAMWGGIAGCVLAVIAIIAILAIKGDIKRLLDKDEIIFDGNFALKKQAIETSLNLLDKVEQNSHIINSEEFIQQAKACYNQMLCVTSNLDIVESFYNWTITGTPVTENQIKKFKYDCRKDIGLKSKKIKIEKIKAEKQAKVKPVKATNINNFEREENIPMPSNEPASQVQQPAWSNPEPKTPTYTQAPVINEQPKPATRPMAPTGIRHVGRPTQAPRTQQSAQRPTSNRLRKIDHE